MEKGFNETEFMAYLESTFNGFDNSFLRGLVENVIAYGLKWEKVSKDQFCYWVSDMLPEVEFGEVAMFIDDNCLTENGKEEKYKAIGNKR